tara:strand:- start:202 stop:306 length:105 start_codon:yes stop_codon:yes gene_type:complete
MTKIKVVSKRNCWCFAPSTPPEKPEKKEGEVNNA